jgi:hypothetical protein
MSFSKDGSTSDFWPCHKVQPLPGLQKPAPMNHEKEREIPKELEQPMEDHPLSATGGTARRSLVARNIVAERKPMQKKYAQH